MSYRWKWKYKKCSIIMIIICYTGIVLMSCIGRYQSCEVDRSTLHLKVGSDLVDLPSHRVRVSPLVQRASLPLISKHLSSYAWLWSTKYVTMWVQGRTFAIKTLQLHTIRFLPFHLTTTASSWYQIRSKGLFWSWDSTADTLLPVHIPINTFQVVPISDP